MQSSQFAGVVHDTWISVDLLVIIIFVGGVGSSTNEEAIQFY